MLITPATISGLQTNFSKVFQSAMSDIPQTWRQIAMSVPSSTRLNTYGWMERLPQMRQWIGPREVLNASSKAYTIENLPYEITVGVDRDDIEDDNLGVYAPLISEMGRQVAYLPQTLISDLVKAGDTSTCFDGQFFFDTDHDLDPAGNQDNDLESTALDEAGFETVKTAMRTFTGADGRALGAKVTHLMVPPQLELEAKRVVVANTIPVAGATTDVGADNLQRGDAGIIVMDELADEPTVWYALDLSREVKPFVLQTRRAAQLVSRVAMTDDNVFWQKEYIWGADGRWGAGFGMWWQAIRINVEAN